MIVTELFVVGFHNLCAYGLCVAGAWREESGRESVGVGIQGRVIVRRVAVSI